MKKVLIVGAAMLLVGCAAIVKKTEHEVTVLTPGAEGAACKVSYHGKPHTYLPSTPATFLPPNFDGPLVVTCAKEGFETSSANVGKELNFVEGITTGIIGGIPAIFADSGTGAMWRYDPEVTIEMAPSGTAPAHESPGDVMARMVSLSPLAVAAGVAPVRAEPKPLARVIKVVRFGDELQLLDSAPSGWLKVADGGDPIGWVHWTAFPVPRQSFRDGVVPKPN
jgi:hypothetical protein